MLRWRALRFFHYVCYDNSRNERTDFYWQFMGSSSRKNCYCRQAKAAGALYANLANAVFAPIYCKLLIPRLGT